MSHIASAFLLSPPSSSPAASRHGLVLVLLHKPLPSALSLEVDGTPGRGTLEPGSLSCVLEAPDLPTFAARLRLGEKSVARFAFRRDLGLGGLDEAPAPDASDDHITLIATTWTHGGFALRRALQTPMPAEGLRALVAAQGWSLGDADVRGPVQVLAARQDCEGKCGPASTFMVEAERLPMAVTFTSAMNEHGTRQACLDIVTAQGATPELVAHVNPVHGRRRRLRATLDASGHSSVPLPGVQFGDIVWVEIASDVDPTWFEVDAGGVSREVTAPTLRYGGDMGTQWWEPGPAVPTSPRSSQVESCVAWRTLSASAPGLRTHPINASLRTDETACQRLVGRPHAELMAALALLARLDAPARTALAAKALTDPAVLMAIQEAPALAHALAREPVLPRLAVALGCTLSADQDGATLLSTAARRPPGFVEWLRAAPSRLLLAAAALEAGATAATVAHVLFRRRLTGVRPSRLDREAKRLAVVEAPSWRSLLPRLVPGTALHRRAEQVLARRRQLLDPGSTRGTVRDLRTLVTELDALATATARAAVQAARRPGLDGLGALATALEVDFHSGLQQLTALERTLAPVASATGTPADVMLEVERRMLGAQATALQNLRAEATDRGAWLLQVAAGGGLSAPPGRGRHPGDPPLAELVSEVTRRLNALPDCSWLAAAGVAADPLDKLAAHLDRGIEGTVELAEQLGAACPGDPIAHALASSAAAISASASAVIAAAAAPIGLRILRQRARSAASRIKHLHPRAQSGLQAQLDAIQAHLDNHQPAAALGTLETMEGVLAKLDEIHARWIARQRALPDPLRSALGLSATDGSLEVPQRVARHGAASWQAQGVALTRLAEVVDAHQAGLALLGATVGGTPVPALDLATAGQERWSAPKALGDGQPGPRVLSATGVTLDRLVTREDLRSKGTATTRLLAAALRDRIEALAASHTTLAQPIRDAAAGERWTDVATLVRADEDIAELARTRAVLSGRGRLDELVWLPDDAPGIAELATALALTTDLTQLAMDVPARAQAIAATSRALEARRAAPAPLNHAAGVHRHLAALLEDRVDALREAVDGALATALPASGLDPLPWLRSAHAALGLDAGPPVLGLGAVDAVELHRLLAGHGLLPHTGPLAGSADDCSPTRQRDPRGASLLAAAS